MLVRIPCLLLCLLPAVAVGAMQVQHEGADAQEDQELTDAQKIYGLSLFWKEVSYNFAFFDQVPDLDWDRTYQEFIPQVLATRSTHEYYRVLQRFAALLKDGHTDVSPPPGLGSPLDYPRVRVRRIQGRPIIVDVGESRRDDLPLGSEIIRVNGVATKEYLEDEILPHLSSSSDHVLRDQGIRGLLLGPAGSEVKITILTREGTTKELTLTRNNSTTDDAWVKGDPPQRGRVEFEWLDDGIAYVALNSFGDEKVVEEFKAALPELRKCKGLVLDIRNNGGGNSANGTVIVRYLTDQPFLAAPWRTRQHIAACKALGRFAAKGTFAKMLYGPYSEDNAWFESPPVRVMPIKAKALSVPIVVLIGHNTASAAEDFLVVLDSTKRAVYVGQNTNGSTGQPLFVDLPGGGTARICTVKCTYPDGREFVGRGIVPDVRVEPTVDDVLNDRDVVLEKGLEVLTERIESAHTESSQ